MASEGAMARTDVHIEQLSSLCLTCIVYKFDNFMTAYTSGNCALQKSFEFLQRRYSIPLLEKLLCHHNIGNYVEFLLNPYLKQANLEKGVRIRNSEAIFNRLKSIGPTLTLLNLAHAKCSCQCFEELAPFLPNVISLDFSFTTISEHSIRSIGKHCCNLKKLKLYFCSNVTDKCIEALCFPNSNSNGEFNSQGNKLECLDILETSVSTSGVICALKNLKGLVDLRHIDVMKALYKLHFNDEISVDKHNFGTHYLEFLKIADISHYPIKFVEMCSVLLPNLKELTIRGINSQLQINALINYPSLKKIELIFDRDFTDSDLSLFLKIKGKYIEDLQIFYGRIAANDLIKFCPQLKSLTIMETKFVSNSVSEYLASKPSLRYLKQLNLHDFDFFNDVDAKSFKLILSCTPNLKVLNLTHNSGFSSEFIESITCGSWVQNVKHLDLIDTDITFYGAKIFILKASNLKTIDLYDTHREEEKCSSAQLRLLNPFVSVEIIHRRPPYRCGFWARRGVRRR